MTYPHKIEHGSYWRTTDEYCAILRNMIGLVKPYEHYFTHLAAGYLAAQPFLDLGEIGARVGFMVILAMATLFQGFQLYAYHYMGAEIDIEMCLMMYAIVFTAAPRLIITATLFTAIFIFITRYFHHDRIPAILQV